MSGIPFTREPVGAERADAIRARVTQANMVPRGSDMSRLAKPEDAEKLFALLSDPAVHAPIYSLPQPLTIKSVEAFIIRHLEEQARGDGVLLIRVSKDDEVVGYSDIQVWPDWAAGELGGALHPDRQGQGEGIRGAATSFTWMFEALGLDLICATAALDNIRTAKLLDHLGFERKGETVSVREDGTTRPSLVWEVTHEAWLRR